MIPIGVPAAGSILAREEGSHRAVALRHAALRGRPGLWGDDPIRPSSVVWLRDGEDQWEAFAVGVPGPALAWLAREATGRRVVLAAPDAWGEAVRRRFEPRARVERSTVLTWIRPTPTRPPAPVAPVRPLGGEDRAAFEALAPAWAVRSWGDYPALLAGGLAVGVPTARPGELAAAAWVVEADRDLAKVGVATAPRFRRLGLGRAAASALVARVEAGGRRRALWVANPDNAASVALARSLGFAEPASEPLLWWDPA